MVYQEDNKVNIDEMEILEFTIEGNSYGINVDKIKEIIQYQAVTPVPNAHPSVEGIFMPRGVMITAIDLKNCLSRGASEKNGLFIITNYRDRDIAFHVDTVVGIHRVSLSDIIPPNAAMSSEDTALTTGIIKKKNPTIDQPGILIIILDFEKILDDISPVETGLTTV